MKIKLITAPTEYPLSVAEIKDALSVYDATQNTLVERALKAAVNISETFTNRRFVTQTWEYYLDSWPDSRDIEIPLPPLVSITSIKYTLDDAVQYTMPAGDYAVDPLSEPGIVRLKRTASWPSGTLSEVNPIVIRFVCGFGAAASVPDEIKQAIIMITGDCYENREDISTATGTIISQMELKNNSSTRLFPFKIFQEFR